MSEDEPGASSAKKPSRMYCPPSVPAMVDMRPLTSSSRPKTMAKGRPREEAISAAVVCSGAFSSLSAACLEAKSPMMTADELMKSVKTMAMARSMTPHRSARFFSARPGAERRERTSAEWR